MKFWKCVYLCLWLNAESHQIRWVLSLFHSHRMCGQNNLWLSTNQMILGSASVWVLLDVQDKLVFTVYNWQMTLELLVAALSLQPSHSLGSSCNAPLPTNRDLHILWTSLSSVGWQWHPKSIYQYSWFAHHVMLCPMWVLPYSAPPWELNVKWFVAHP